jgi:hypothetical protein
MPRTLFIYYLFHELGFSINQIVGAGASNLAGVYRNLTGHTDDPFPVFKSLLDDAFPSQTNSAVPPPNVDDPWPLRQGIRHVWWDPALNQGQGDFRNDQWSGPNVGSNRPVQAAAGDPATMVTGRTQHMFYRANKGPINWFKKVVVSSTNGPGWGRMLPWDKQGDNLITYTETPPGGTPIIKVARSNPTSPTWTEIASIPSPTDHGGHIQEQSQMVQLPDATILMAMRNRQIDLNWFGLPILKSTDGGSTWSFVSQFILFTHST